MHHNRRGFVRLSGAAVSLAALGLSGRAGAQNGQPHDVVKIVTGFPPGGTSDTLCRRVAESLRGGSYTKSALVENKAGAGGQIAVQTMKGAPTDGSVILQTPASMLMIYPHIYKKLAYDAFADVTAVTLACTFDFGFCVGPAVPDSVKTVPEFLAWCKANPDKANFGSPAAGSVPHFIGVLLGQAAGIELKHVAYRGTQPAIQDMVARPGPGGVRAGRRVHRSRSAPARSRILGVSGAQRSRFAPDVPTFAEQGYKDMVFSEWFGFFAPGGTPAPVVQNDQHRAAGRARPEGRGRWPGRDGPRVDVVDARRSSRRLLKESYDRWGPIVKKIGFTANS